MQPAEPSRTALRAAAHRAAHQTCEGGRVFTDPLAHSVLGAPVAGFFPDGLETPAVRSMRLFIAARSRFAEQRLAAAIERGVRQYVLLGAGLVTFACRNPFAHVGLKVFEVDHPATQAWKLERLAAAGLAAPSLAFAPIDFEHETLAEGLAAAGFDPGRAAFFAWLGVIVYLTRPAAIETLRFIADLPARAEVVFDYGEPVSAYPAPERARLRAREARLAAIGEPWITRFTPPQIAGELRRLGFVELEDLGPAEIDRRLLGAAPRRTPGAHLVWAAKG